MQLSGISGTQDILIYSTRLKVLVSILQQLSHVKGNF